MKIRFGRLILYVLTGLLVLPVVLFFALLVLFHTFDPRCGAPGDSGGCEMGVFALSVASAVPGAIGGLVLALWRDWRAAR